MRKKLAFRTKTIDFLFCLLLLATLTSTVRAAESLRTGPGKILFVDSYGNKDKPITVWYYKPKNLRPKTPVVFVMHGMKRTGQKYRDSWIKYAEKAGFLLLAPEFSKRHYPGSKQYNYGNIYSSSGEPVSKSKWTFSAIEHIFDYVKDILKLRTENYSIYGHSAGSQFVHRMVLFLPEARINIAICANAGFYMMPTNEFKFPYGLKKTQITEQGLKKAFAKKLVVLLGNKDIDENHEGLKKTQKAMAQGKHRLQRGRKFFKTAKKTASELKTPLNWRLKIVKNAEHRNSQMAKAAAKLLIKRKSQKPNIRDSNDLLLVEKKRY